MARRNGNGNGHRGSVLARLGQGASDTWSKTQGSQVWTSIFRPGSIFRKGYTDSPRNRSYVIMNSLIYHLHPVKVKRHAVKVSYTLCLGGRRPSAPRCGLAVWGRASRSRHIGPLMPPSLRTRQKWIMISSATARGIATQWST